MDNQQGALNSNQPGKKDFLSAFNLEPLLGALIPLTCGHNGYLKSAETNLYELHLRNSGFLEKLDEPHNKTNSANELTISDNDELDTIESVDS